MARLFFVIFVVMINKNTTTLMYLEYPSVPRYDYYVDTDGNYVYLAENETHLWQDGEKDSQGNIKSSTDSEYTSKTVELEFKDEDKLVIANRILRTLGVSMENNEVVEVSNEIVEEHDVV